MPIQCADGLVVRLPSNQIYGVQTTGITSERMFSGGPIGVYLNGLLAHIVQGSEKLIATIQAQSIIRICNKMLN